MEKELPYAIYDIRFEPFKDRHEICIKILNDTYGIKVSDLDVSPIDTLINIYHSLIPKKERRVVESIDFSCPEEVKNGYAQLKFKISKGFDLNPHLSKQIFNPKLNDGMHLDFGLYHLHLGVELEKDKKGNIFSKRSGPILVAYVADDAIYCVGIFEHSSQLWSSSKLIEVIDREWPYLIESKKLTCVKDISPIIEDKDRAELRKIGLNTAVTLSNGVSYSWLGNGIAASGGSAMAGMYVANANRLISILTPVFIKEIISRDDFKDLIPVYHGDISLKLVCLPNERMTAVDKKTGNIYHFDSVLRRFIFICPTYLPKYAIYHMGVELLLMPIIINALLKTNQGNSIGAYLNYPSIYIIPK
ncbi:hypothetical protein [Pectobacterium brasiliense]|uniref:hypothetical protein n=1 Tax=Pectobacterium brasiliense TaxID=180957 RepID=UPI0015DE2417|nr:hypothetical protein [Pectobacterium brasiliense]MBA0213242.1 hypothetical protein [Pectobacterium brasiliense]